MNQDAPRKQRKNYITSLPQGLPQVPRICQTHIASKFRSGPGGWANAGSKPPIRGPLPLLGPAAGYVDSLRRTSQGRVFRGVVMWKYEEMR
jgi:hypothetical protein